METVKGVLFFCNAAIFYDYKSIGIVVELNQKRKCININIHATIPPSRKLVSLSIIDDMIKKIDDANEENLMILFMIWEITFCICSRFQSS